MDSRSSGEAGLDPIIEERVDSVLRLMTLEEKIGQLNVVVGSMDFANPSPGKETQLQLAQIQEGKVGALLSVSGSNITRNIQAMAVNESRLGIPLLFGEELVHGYKTMFPVPLAEAASWDLATIEHVARLSAIEATSTGIHWTTGLTTDLVRDARLGEVVRGAGEDPYLSAMVATAKIKGYQGGDLKAKNTIAAGARHFVPTVSRVGTGQELGKVHEKVAEQLRLPPIRAAFDARVSSIILSGKNAQGLRGQKSLDLVQTVLRDRWGFQGLVVMEPSSIDGWISEGAAKDRKEATSLAMNAGCDMDMGHAYLNELANSMQEGQVSKKKLDQAVRRILRLKFQLGLFDDPYRYCNQAAEKQDLMHRDHIEAAREIGRKSIVLLKNENNILPLSKDVKTIAVIGPLANDRDVPLGSLRSRARRNSGISLLRGLRETASPNTRFLYAIGCRLTEGKRGPTSPLTFNETDRSGFAEAIAAARQADVVIMALGEDCWQTGAATLQEDIGLQGLQQELLEEVYQVNKNVVLVLMNGRPLAINWAAERLPAIVEAWYLGHMSGFAIADVLWGDYNPAGKLPITFPDQLKQGPVYYNHLEEATALTGRRSTGAGARFPFGFGLSYTNFSYGELKLSSSSLGPRDSLIVSVTITNSGDRVGEEVVQLYLRDLVSSTERPVKELKGFKKVKLAPGTNETIRFIIQRDDLAFYTENNKQKVEPGTFKVFVGTNSRDVQEAQFECLE